MVGAARCGNVMLIFGVARSLPTDAVQFYVRLFPSVSSPDPGMHRLLGHAVGRRDTSLVGESR